MTVFIAPAFFSGLVLSLSLIMAIGPQNAHVMRMGLKRQHLWLTIGVCVATDIVLIAVGVAGLAKLGGLSSNFLSIMTGGGALVLLYNTAAIMAMLRHYREDRDFMYGLDIQFMDAARATKGK